MITYTEIYDDIKTPPTLLAIKKEDDNGNVWSIPINPANSDYQAYLAWLENPEAALSTPIVTE